MLITGVTILIVVASVILFLNGAPFGSIPFGEGLKKIQQSPNFRNGQFQNLSYTPSLTDGASFPGVLKEFFFDKSKLNIPPAPLPSKKLTCFISVLKKISWFGLVIHPTLCRSMVKKFSSIQYLAETRLP